MKDDIIFYSTALIIPLTFLVFGSFFRWIIKRKWEWELLYLGMDVALAGIAAALTHLIAHTDAVLPAPYTPLLSRPGLTPPPVPPDTHTVVGAFMNLPFAARGAIGVFFLFLALILATSLQSYFSLKPKPLSRRQQAAEIFWLGFLANLASTGAVILMERLLR